MGGRLAAPGQRHAPPGWSFPRRKRQGMLNKFSTTAKAGDALRRTRPPPTFKTLHPACARKRLQPDRTPRLAAALRRQGRFPATTSRRFCPPLAAFLHLQQQRKSTLHRKTSSRWLGWCCSTTPATGSMPISHGTSASMPALQILRCDYREFHPGSDAVPCRTAKFPERCAKRPRGSVLLQGGRRLAAPPGVVQPADHQ